MVPVVLPASLSRRLTGVLPCALAAGIAELAFARTAPVCVALAPDLARAESLLDELAALLPRRFPGQTIPQVHILAEEPGDRDLAAKAFESECERVAVLTALRERRSGETASPPLLLITTPAAFFRPAPHPDALGGREIRLFKDADHNFQELAQRLGHELGYDCEAVCEAPGQYAVRGGLLDVYPLNAQAPVRLDFFGDTLTDIREFDPATQLSGGPALAGVVIAAARQGDMAHDARNLLRYLPSRVNWLLIEPAALCEKHPERCEIPERYASPSPTLADLRDRDGADDIFLGLSEHDQEVSLFPPETPRQEVLLRSLEPWRPIIPVEAFGADRLAAEQTARADFLVTLQRWQQDGHRIELACANDGEEQRLREVLAAETRLDGFRPVFTRGLLRQGFRLDWDVPHPAAPLAWLAPGSAKGMVLVTDSEVFGRMRVRPSPRRRRAAPHRSQVDQLLDFSELTEGDHVVHLQHGICRYRGLTRLTLNQRPEEVVSLEFADSVTLHLPLHESHLLTRYVGLTKILPKLAKLGSGQWEKTRRKAEQATLDLAAELLRTQATRQARQRPPCGPDTAWQTELENAFPYTETPDQHRAISEAKADLEAPSPMDRLLCGDVGFGKTEVALRAAFKAVASGRQVAVLVPTTILAQQHFLTFRDRFAEYPIAVEMLSRFRSPKEQDEILKQVTDGRVDVLVGTHRLLGKDVKFPRLGLLVIDEEHRFGVRQKEQIKSLKQDVDVLAMSATPIPRTLHMALTGARSLSVIETAPVNRLPIETVVRPYDEATVISSIRFEISRGGQVFYLHNRVQTIHACAAKLRDALPELRIAIGHGQMDEHDLEHMMTRFVAGEFDVLVCTTIIETGLDIPNCNTIIIEGADRFGLSQLYQLRGRVGRSPRQAWCYLFLHRRGSVAGLSRERLATLKQFNQLGAGFRIAMRDLELRGAGNLLGPQQSGQIAGVGFELYCDLLRQSVSRLKGEKSAKSHRAQIRLDFVTLGGAAPDPAEKEGPRMGYATLKAEELEGRFSPVVEASLPADYIGETRLRVDFYRRLALAANEAEVKEIGAALEDRFGPRPKAVEILLVMTALRCLAEARGLLSVETEGPILKMLKASGVRDDYVKLGPKFPRLEKTDPVKKLAEIRSHLKRLAEV